MSKSMNPLSGSVFFLATCAGKPAKASGKGAGFNRGTAIGKPPRLQDYLETNFRKPGPAKACGPQVPAGRGADETFALESWM